jgi:hypothetical protein
MNSEPLNPQERESTYNLQKLFASSQLPDVPVCEVKIFARYNGEFLQKARFFLYQGKWRNCEYKTKFSNITFDEDKIRPNVYVG